MVAEPVRFDTVKAQVQELAKTTVQQMLKDKKYDPKEAPELAHKISEAVIQQLPNISKEFKYTVNCMILSKTECGLHLSSSCYWNAQTDGSVIEKFEGDMFCILTIFSYSI